MLNIPVDPETQRALAESGIRELRSPPLQAVVLLRRALGLPDCHCDETEKDKQPEAANV